MKKITLIALLFALNWQINAQTSEISLQNRNELKLDVAFLIGGILKAEYEYLLSDWSSIGVSAFFNLNSGPRELGTQVLGNYRLYFGKEPVSGFFIEGNLGIISGYLDPYYSSSNDHYSSFGIGIALGWKWYIPKSGIVLDIFGGGGRLFGDVASSVGPYPRAGICVGKRF